MSGYKGVQYRVRDSERMNSDVQRDASTLHESGHLPEAQPSFALAPRRQRPLWVCYLIGIPLGGVVAWLVPTSDYTRALRHSVSEKYMSPRDAGTAASAISGYMKHKARIDAKLVDTDQPHSETASGSRWLGDPSSREKVSIRAQIMAVEPQFDEQHPDRPPKYLYVMRTPEGDLVRWRASKDKALEQGDDVTLQGKIRAHSWHNGEKQTEIWYCDNIKLHSPP